MIEARKVLQFIDSIVQYSNNPLKRVLQRCRVFVYKVYVAYVISILNQSISETNLNKQQDEQQRTK